MANTKRYGEIPSPCLKPLAPLKYAARAPLTLTEYSSSDAGFDSAYKFRRKLEKLKQVKEKAPIIVVKAFLRSILRAHLAGPEHL